MTSVFSHNLKAILWLRCVGNLELKRDSPTLGPILQLLSFACYGQGFHMKVPDNVTVLIVST